MGLYLLRGGSCTGGSVRSERRLPFPRDCTSFCAELSHGGLAYAFPVKGSGM
jgi:hypothetical protein